jgi:predicted RNA-binding Zn-ribbon protein involved in translation (DUF1610 family)
MDEGPYTPAWRAYRRWSRAFWLLFLGFLPAVDGIYRLARMAGSDGSWIGLVALAWMLAFAVAGYHHTNFDCPRCGEPFFYRFDARIWRRSWQHNPFARHCMHCGLPKWAASDPGPQPPS